LDSHCPPLEEVVTVVFIREWPEVYSLIFFVLSTLPLRLLPPKGDKIKNSFYTYINYDKVSPYKSQLVYDASHLIQVGNYKNTSPLNLLEFFLPLPACGRQGRSTNRTKTEIYFILIIHLRPKGHLLQRRTKSRNKNAPPRLPPKLRYRRDPPLSAQGGLPKEGNFNTKYRRLKG